MQLKTVVILPTEKSTHTFSTIHVKKLEKSVHTARSIQLLGATTLSPEAYHAAKLLFLLKASLSCGGQLFDKPITVEHPAEGQLVLSQILDQERTLRATFSTSPNHKAPIFKQFEIFSAK